MARYTEAPHITTSHQGRVVNLAKGEPVKIKILPTGDEWKFLDDFGQLQISKVELLGR